MNILVYGAGAVGGYLGARLAQANHNVTLITRPIMADIINATGLEVHEGSSVIQTRPAAVISLRQAMLNNAAYDVMLVSMKSYDVEAAINELIAFCPDPPPLITLQNGIGIEELFVAQFGAERVIAGSLTTPLTLDTNQSILVERSDRGLALAPVQAKQNIGRWVELFQAAGVNTQACPDYKAMKWSKALLNMVGNASSAILNRHPKVIYGYEPTFRLEMVMLKEALAVMKKLKLKPLNLPGSPASRLAFGVQRVPPSLLKPILANMVAGGRGNKMPSFQTDLAAGKDKSEVLYHNGAVAKFGRLQNVATPVNTALTDILLKIAHKEIDYQEYNGKPDRLVAEVRKYQQAVKR
jgi:2-dehydropantoate 2-reductase